MQSPTAPASLLIVLTIMPVSLNPLINNEKTQFQQITVYPLLVVLGDNLLHRDQNT